MDFKELFQVGFSYSELVKALEAEDKELMDKYLENISQNLDENLRKEILKVKKDFKILIFAEGWCPDCQINLPPILYMTEINKKIEMKILKRDTNEKYLQPYLVSGKPKIPTILILDKNYNEIGHIIERPKLVKELLGSPKESDVIIAKRKYKKGDFLQEIIKDIIAIIKEN